MGLGDFLFGNRKKYNGRVDLLLREELKIDTNHQTNPAFPGILYYLRLIDQGWHSKWPVEETVTMIACSLFSGIRNENMFKSSTSMDEMRRLIVRFVQTNYQNGNIRQPMLEAAKKDIIDWSL